MDGKQVDKKDSLLAAKQQKDAEAKKQADNIYVLEAGRVAEAGKHNELLAKNGVYSRLWNVQYELENYGFKDDVEKRTSGNEA